MVRFLVFFASIWFILGCTNQSLNSVQLGLSEVTFDVRQDGSGSGILRVVKASQTVPLKITCPAANAKLMARKDTSEWINVADFQCRNDDPTDVSLNLSSLISQLAAKGITLSLPEISLELKISSSSSESKGIAVRIIETDVLPSETSASLSGGAPVTNSAVVSLNSSALFRGPAWESVPQSIYVTGQPGCTSGGFWQPYFFLIPIVPLDQFDQVNIKYFAFKDDLGNVSDCFQTSIVHDGTAPQLVSVSIDSGALQTSTGIVSVDVTTLGSDVSQMVVFNNSNCSGPVQWMNYSSSVTMQLATTGLQFVSARGRDAAGNTSNCVSDAIIFDNDPPEVPTALTLANGLSSTDNEATIGVRIGGILEGDTALLYSDSSCTTLLGSAVAIGNEATITQTLAVDGQYDFFARARDPQGRDSACAPTSLTYVLDRVGPEVILVNSSMIDGDYATGTTISLQVVFSDPVLVTGVPTLGVDINGTTTLAAYSSGSGSSTLTFQFVVASWMTEDDLNYSSTDGLNLPSGASISDLIGNTANVTLPDLSSPNALAQQKDLKVNFAVYITHAYGPAEGIYGNGDSPEATLIWSGPMAITATPQLSGTIESTSRTFTYQSRSYPLIGITKFQYSSLANELDLDGINLSALSPTASFNNIFASPAQTSIPPAVSTLSGFRILNGVIPSYSFGTSALDHIRTVIESSGSIDIAVQLSSPAIVLTRINYVIRPATATLTADYQGLSGFIEISSGQSTAQITVPIVNDLVVESPETFFVDLISSDFSRPSTVTPHVSKTVYILDDDGPAQRNIADVASGTSHLCALYTNGSIKCTGSNSVGQLGQSNTNAYSGLVDVTLPGPAQAISAGHQQTCAIVLVASENRLYCWGANANSSFGLGDSNPRSTPTLIVSAGNQVNAVVHNHDTNVAICILVYDPSVSGNSIRCAGSGLSGQLGRGSLTTSSTFVAQSPVIPVAVSQLAFGRSHACALANNDLYCWGNNNNNQLGLGTLDVSRRLVPTLVASATGIIQLRTFFDTTCIQLSATTVNCWGQASGNSFGEGSTSNTGDYPGRLATLNLGGATISSLRAGRTHACALLSNESARCWGTANYSSSSGYLFSASPSSTQTQSVPFTVQQLWPLWGTSCFTSNSLGSFGCVGANLQTPNLLFEQSTFNTPQTVSIVGDTITKVQQARQLACYSTASGRLYCMTPMSSQTAGIGDGTNNVARYSPVDLSATNITDFAIGDAGGCYLRSDQTLWCWGQNTAGSIGDGSTTSRNQPVFVLHRVRRIEAGAQHFCAERADNSLWCWGLNSSGQVGNSTFVNQTRPVQVLDQISDFALGNAFSCALKNNQILCWGRNGDGEMGDGSGVNRSSPNPALDIHAGTMVKIEAGAAHACVRHSNGFVKCWGDNASGQLGRGDTSDAYIPWQTIGSGVVSMALGELHSCFIFDNESVRCVGSGELFQTGTNNANNHLTLSTAPNTLSSTNLLWTGRSNSTCARQTNGTIQCWGRNSGLFVPRPPPLNHAPRPFPQVQW